MQRCFRFFLFAGEEGERGQVMHGSQAAFLAGVAAAEIYV